MSKQYQLKYINCLFVSFLLASIFLFNSVSAQESLQNLQNEMEEKEASGLINADRNVEAIRNVISRGGGDEFVVEERRSTFIGLSGSAEWAIVFLLVAALPLSIIFFLVMFSEVDVPKVDVRGWPVQRTRPDLQEIISEQGFRRFFRTFNPSSISRDVNESINPTENKVDYGSLENEEENQPLYYEIEMGKLEMERVLTL